LLPVSVLAQHQSRLVVELDDAKKSLNIQQELTFYNQTPDTLTTLILNDWNHAFSSKSTPLAKRFSDEFVRSFHLAKDYERGSTNNMTIIDGNQFLLGWIRPEKHPDLIEVYLRQKLAPGEKCVLHLTYVSKIPSDKFTKFGYSNDGSYNLKDWFVTPARYENHQFICYSNNNLDDIANATSNFELEFRVPSEASLVSDLNDTGVQKFTNYTNYSFSGKKRNTFSLFIGPKSEFRSYKNDLVDVENGIQSRKVTDIQKAIIVDRIVHFVNDNVGHYPYQKITVSEADYARNPFYGLNQLPAFISPFSDSYLYEIKFLKTYLHNFLLNSLHLDPRKDNWIYDGIQIYVMMKYIDEQYPDQKMMGAVSTLRLLRGYNFVNLSFNGQYSYFYMLMARKNLDQPIGDPKNKLIKFNEQIAGKYRAGLSFRYLDNYLDHEAVPESIREFYTLSSQVQTDRADFEIIVKKKAGKNIDWFFNTIIDSRDIIDYKFTDLEKGKDSISVTLKNKTGATVPIPVYGVKKGGDIVFKQWIEQVKTDSTFTFARKDADKIVINYENEVPEYNLRNNWKSLHGFTITNRPIKFNFMKDLEDPYYNQILYVPTITYNLYDGISPGIRLHNKTILDKPFTFDINPIYAPKTKSLTGAASLAVNQNLRYGQLYNIRYSLGGSYSHYAPDAAYYKITPQVVFRIRDNDFRDNRKELFSMREVIVHRDSSPFVTGNDADNENYSVFNMRYGNSRSEVTNTFSFQTDAQFANKFGKGAVELEYRKLFENNRQVNLRLFGGLFMYNKTTNDFFSFALDRPTDYLFDYNYYGRSESTGFFSQQLILSEGGFKSKLNTPFANQWITTLNGSFNIWNWIEVYGDAGLVKNHNTDPNFVYDSGIRLNLVTDYFELYFPVYSNNGWEVAQPNYNEKIRFIITIDPKTLVNLFTRKWL
jgi:hypothetical protein